MWFKLIEFAHDRQKVFWEKEEMLVTSIFSWCQNVFKTCLHIMGLLKVGIVWQRFKRFLDQSILKAFCSRHTKCYPGYRIVFERVDNNVEKGEKAEDQHFLPFPK